ncbi:hypothetical protein [Lysobacter sp. CA199]|uniref:hypothetical protein n=1 Tax=Lysobacter sp. CA199 TaxID=3455608 RepID=UPI003F8D52B0
MPRVESNKSANANIGMTTIAAPKARMIPSGQSNFQMVNGINRHAVPTYKIEKIFFSIDRLQALPLVGAGTRFRAQDWGGANWQEVGSRDGA